MRMLGKLAAVHDPRTLKLSTYTAKLPPPPAVVDNYSKISGWGMMLNDSLGDCAIAGPGHMEKQWSTLAGIPYTPTNLEILQAYEDVSGYQTDDPNNPQTNATDTGCVLLDVMKFWRNFGIGGRKIAAFVALEKGNIEQLRQAIFLFGNACLGLALPASAEGQTVWSVGGEGDTRPGSWGGHCVPAMGYDGLTIPVITWGAPLKMTSGFYADYNDEAYAVLSHDWIEKTGKAPNGFDLAQLQADLAEVTV